MRAFQCLFQVAGARQSRNVAFKPHRLVQRTPSAAQSGNHEKSAAYRDEKLHKQKAVVDGNEE